MQDTNRIPTLVTFAGDCYLTYRPSWSYCNGILRSSRTVARSRCQHKPYHLLSSPPLSHHTQSASVRLGDDARACQRMCGESAPRTPQKQLGLMLTEKAMLRRVGSGARWPCRVVDVIDEY
jgi:hypothetical protein